MRKFTALGLALAATVAFTGLAAAQDKPLKVGILNDQNGPFSDLNGAGSVEAARMAVEDFGGKVLGRTIEVVFADAQNKPDVAAAVANRWFDQDGVSAIFDLPVSPVALAVQTVARERNKISVITSSGATSLISKDCSPTGFLWAYNAYSLARSTAYAVTKGGDDTWFFIGSDYTFGLQLEKDATDVILANDGKVLGAVHHPINSSDFSSYLLQAQGSGAKVIGLANGGADTVNAIKQAGEFGITQAGQKLAAMILFEPDVQALGLDVAQGLVLTSAFYWDMNEETRAWSNRFSERFGGKKPTVLQAAVYSGVLHYLKGVEAAGADDGKLVADKMRELPVKDFMTNGNKVRADGYLMRDFYLFEVKKPAESSGPGDFFRQIGSIPAADAAPPVEGSECSLLKG